MKNQRFLEFQAVLERGVLNYYASRADSTDKNRNKRRDYKYLDGARISALPTPSSFVVHFNDGSSHRLSVVSTDENVQVERQKWINMLQEHAAYSSHYLWGGGKRSSDSDDDYEAKAKPLGCMSDALSSASASFEVLQRQLNDCTNSVDQMQRTMQSPKASMDSAQASSITSLMVREIESGFWVIFFFFSFLF